MRLINSTLSVLAALALSNLIMVKGFDIGFIDVTSSQEELINDLSISYITGYFVYFFTVVIPKFQSDIERNKHINKQFRFTRNYINVRLKHLTNNQQLSEDEFVDLLKSKFYSDTFTFIKKKTPHEVSYYQAFNEIMERIDRLHALEHLIIKNNNSKLYDSYRDVLYHTFLRHDNLYLTQTFEEIKKNKRKIEIGKSLYNLYFTDLPKAIELSEAPFYKKEKKS